MSSSRPADDRQDDAELFSRGLVRKIAWPMLLGVLVYGTLLLYADAAELTRSIRSVPWSYFGAGIALSLGNFGLRFVRWHLYLRRLGLRVPVADSAIVFLAGFSMTITPGKMGEVLKSLLLKEAHDIAVSRTAPIPVAERITDFIGLLVLSGVGMFGIPGGPLVGILSLIGGLSLVLACTWRRLGHKIITIAARVPKIARYEAKLRTAYDTLLELSRPRMFLLGTCLSAVAWGLQCACVPVFGHWFGVELNLLEAFVAYSAPLIAGAISLIPGGLGLTEASMTGVVSSLGGPAATLAVATAITILVRLVSLWFAVVLGFGALLLWRLRFRDRRAAASQRG